MHYSEWPVPPQLSPYVRLIWRLCGESPAGAQGTSTGEPIVPDGCPEIILNCADAFLQETPSRLRAQPLSFVAGQLSRAMIVHTPRRVDVWGIRFHPWGSSAFLGVAAHELRDRIEPVDCVTSLGGLTERLGEAPSDRARYEMILTSLCSYASRQRPVDDRTVGLIGFAARHDDWSVRTLSSHAGVSERRVEQVFREEVGLPPRLLARIRRLQHALRIGRAELSWTWARIAATAGYNDQSHLIRDCRDIAGVLPTQLRPAGAEITDALLSGADVIPSAARDLSQAKRSLGLRPRDDKIEVP